jgi:hypothetical protein
MSVSALFAAHSGAAARLRVVSRTGSFIGGVSGFKIYLPPIAIRMCKGLGKYAMDWDAKKTP